MITFNKFLNEELNINKNSTDLIVKVKHMIKYLQQFDPETPLFLDHDGWLQSEINAIDEIDLIKKRGLFGIMNGGIIINN